ncbi:MAG TPA: divalent-cation tolerance protein CutA [Methanocella sp.]|nr:divalent-cation tolerance protein CutA [Methanocella sp.]
MISVVYVIARDMGEAGLIARYLVEERLIACANFYVVSSVFRWEGNLEEGGEVAMICKTRTELVATAITRIKELHSYKLPCITSWKIDEGYGPYLDWVRGETRRL